MFVFLYINGVCVNGMRAVKYYLGNHQKKTYAPTWMHHEGIVLSERSQIHKIIYCMNTFMTFWKKARFDRRWTDPWSPELRGGESVWLWRANMREFFGVLEWLCILCVVMVTNICICYSSQKWASKIVLYEKNCTVYKFKTSITKQRRFNYV